MYIAQPKLSPGVSWSINIITCVGFSYLIYGIQAKQCTLHEGTKNPVSDNAWNDDEITVAILFTRSVRNMMQEICGYKFLVCA